MKKLSLAIGLFLLAFALNAQVFNSASTLRKKQFSLGLEPALFMNGDNNLYLFVHGGAGLTSKVDFGLKLGIGDELYFGGDVEFRLARIVSLSVGAHSFGEFGLDGTLLLSGPISSGVYLFGGLDMDVLLEQDNDQLQLWIPVGVEVSLKRTMSFIFEAEISVTDYYNVLGGGLNFYF
jgi:hypothetical protein